MVFSSTIFLAVFLPLLLIVYYNPVFKSLTFKNIILFLASLVFYAWGEPIYVFLMIFSVMVSWGIGLALEEANRKDVKKIFLVVGISYHVAILFIFKYLSFIMTEWGKAVHREFQVHIALPIGISFFTFQMMSYIFDVYYGKARAQRNVLYVGLYVALFPQLIAGPIVRYEQIAAEINCRAVNKEDFTDGMQRFIYGLGKKVLLANYLAQIADNIFDYTRDPSMMTAWLGALAYTLQIYFDFSGYSDMAIGLGRLFGFHFAENFNYPYIAKTVTDFWRRWHISLSAWFRDYVYIPMGGNRVKRARWIFNLLFVWLLTGIWHGANWTFLMWGLFYFVVLLAEKLLGVTQKNVWFSRVYTLIIVIVAWVIFRSENMMSAVQYLSRMFGFTKNAFVDKQFFYYLDSGKVVLPISILLALPSYQWLKRKMSGHQNVFEMVEALFTVGIFLLSVVFTISSTYNPFIYFNF